MPTGETPTWHSHDSVVDEYERAAVPWFTPLARDLVERTVAPDIARLLDIGAGTGLVARFARSRLGAAVEIVGLDPSRAMLRGTPAETAMQPVNGAAPDLPLASGTFCLVAANLSLSHVPDLEETVSKIRRVLRHEGRIGFTAWAPDTPAIDGDQRRAANEVAEEVAASWVIGDSSDPSPAPWEATLSDPDSIRDLLAPGFHDVAVEPVTHRVRLRVDDLVTAWWGSGRYRRSTLGEDRFAQLMDETRHRLLAEFGESVVSVDNFWVATATV